MRDGSVVILAKVTPSTLPLGRPGSMEDQRETCAIPMPNHRRAGHPRQAGRRRRAVSATAPGGDERSRAVEARSSHVATVPAVGNWIDHVVLAAPSLEVGCQVVETRTGVAPTFGGVHTGAGTHNALLSLGAPSYLEVIARDPGQPDAPPSPLVPAELDAPRLVAFAVGCDDIDAAVADLRAAGIVGVADPYAMSRRRPDGSELKWRIAFAGQPGGATPFLISWDHGGSPAYDAPAGGRLVALRAGDPEPDRARQLLDALGVDVAVEHALAPRLEATIATDAGEITLT